MTDKGTLRNVDDLYPLTPTQSGLLYHALATPESAMYFEQVRFDLEGALDVGAFRAAWHAVVRRHPALRTAFVWEGVDEPLQVVRSDVTLPWDELDWSVRPEPEARVALDALAAERRRVGFDLQRAPILRLALVRIGEQLTHVIWDFHHIVIDGWSAGQVMHEVVGAYDDLRAGKDVDLSPARPFRDYVAWLKHQDRAAAEQFWKAELGSFESPTVLHVDRPAPASAVELGTTRMSLSRSTSDALKSLARSERVTLNTVVQAAWGIVLRRYSGDDDIVFGVTVSGRPADVAGVERIVGMFLNVLPLRLHVTDDRSTRSWLRDVQDRQLAISDYDYSSLPEVQRCSSVAPGLPLFETVVIFENFPTVPSDPNGSLRVANRTVFEQTSFPLALLVGPGDCIEALALFNSARFDTPTVDRLLSHLAVVLESIAVAPDAPIGEIELLSGPERQQMIVEWNDTGCDYPDHATIQELFDAQADARPDAVALILGDRTMTYRELRTSSNKLAHHLIGLGVGARTRIGIAIPRSFDLLVAVLATVKAGGVYVPLDPEYPRERIRLIIEDADAGVILTVRDVMSSLPETDGQQICVDDLDTADESDADPEIRSTTDDPLFITFTSGSTGRPKGVINHHRGALNRLQWQWDTFPLEPGEVGGQKTTLNFVDHVFEIWGTLLRGHALALIPDDVVKDPSRLVEVLGSYDIRRIAIVPSYLTVLLDVVPDIGARLPRLRYWAGSGEPTSGALARRFRTALPDAILLNFYGMSEATVDATWYDDRWDIECPTLPIGKPIANMRAYVLDHARRPVPIGVPGEIYVGGVGVAHGYVGRPDLTNERFLTNPYEDEHDGRFYRTGDLGRWLPSGHIEYLGRIDDQIKIRGFRVEPAEIEAVLRSEPGVSDALVIAHQVGDDTSLAAYVIGDGVNAEDLRDLARAHLPAYMVPTHVELIDSFPRTPNGKVDRRALPRPRTRIRPPRCPADDGDRAGGRRPLEGAARSRLRRSG